MRQTISEEAEYFVGLIVGAIRWYPDNPAFDRMAVILLLQLSKDESKSQSPLLHHPLPQSTSIL